MMIEEDVLYGMKRDPLAWAVHLDARDQVRVVRRPAGAAGSAGASAASAGSSEQVRKRLVESRVVMIPELDFQPFGDSGSGFGSNKKKNPNTYRVFMILDLDPDLELDFQSFRSPIP